MELAWHKDMDKDTQRLTHGPTVQSRFSTVTAAFYHYAQSHSAGTALRDLSGSVVRDVTYRELALLAQALASQLRDIGIVPNQRVPLVAKRGVDMIVGILAILSCGAQYVPLDGGVAPDSTIEHVFAQCGGRIVVCTSAVVKRVRAMGFDMKLVVVDTTEVRGSLTQYLDSATPESGCYVIYTSGKSVYHLITVLIY